MTVFAGTVLPYGGTSAPSGFLLCDGSAVSRTTYSTLFAAIGTTYGAGDDSTTFNIPDLRGRVVAGQDDMGGTSANRLTGQSGGVDGDVLGAAGGLETHTLTVAQLASHSHTGSTNTTGDHSHTYPQKVDGGTDPGMNEESNTVTQVNTSTAGSHSHTVTINNTGSDAAHNNVQPTLILNYIIATEDTSGGSSVSLANVKTIASLRG
jgi:microcystin-dependent protein